MSERPNPDALLARVKADEARDGRAKLKIFFGFAPGVGKTYAMLEAAQRARSAGVDIVAGIVETHARLETARLLEGLAIMPRAQLDHRGATLYELDIDALLTRKPKIALVDELAHSNAPGSRHSKRWQDVFELLDAGIDVWTTINVQHVASLNDVVAQITQVQVREVVPDHVIDRADEIELIDIPHEELLARLRDGKVYLGEQAERAAKYFFQRGNLLALRELALRRTAERVDRELIDFRREHGIGGQWPVTERLLVCVGPAPQSDKLVRATRRMAAGLRCSWIAMSVQTATPMSDAERERVEAHLKLAESLGAEVERGVGRDVASGIIDAAKRKNVTRIIVGKPRTKSFTGSLRGSLVDDVVRRSGDIDVHAISGDDAGAPVSKPVSVPEPFGASQIMLSLGVIGLTTGVSFLLYGTLALGDISMLYLLAITLNALWFGRIASIIGAVAAVAAFDFCFVSPRFTFNVSDAHYMVTFAMMFGVGLLVSTLMLRLRRQEHAALQREARKSTLYAISKKLGLALSDRHVAQVAADEASVSLGRDIVVLMPEANGTLVRAAASQGATIEPDTHAVAKWAYEHTSPAGIGTDTLPGARAFCLPLSASVGAVGVLVVAGTGALTPDQRELLSAIGSQTALALERWQLAEEANEAAISARTEALRSSLLSAVSHDLRTPLAAIGGSASTLASMRASLNETQTQDMLETIQEEAQRMERLVTNLLDMTRIEAGLIPKRERVPLEEIVGAVATRLEHRMQGHSLDTDVPDTLPLLSVDPVLIEQVLINLVENAIKYTGAGTRHSIIGRAEQAVLTIDVLDEGPGIPIGEESIIFDKFYRGKQVAATGAGLGLPICKGIIEAHGGSIDASNRREGGARFRDSPAHCGGVMKAGPLVLLIEDEPQVRRFLRTTLAAAGYSELEASTAEEGFTAASSHNPDVILLDLGLPDADGLELLERLREAALSMPVIVLTARSRDDDKVRALDSGADDYLTKPFSAAELLARIRVALRHRDERRGGVSLKVFQIGTELAINFEKHEVCAQGKPVHLSPTEMKLLSVLVRHAGKVVTHSQLLKDVWGAGHAHQTDYLRVYMTQLRRKLEKNPAQPKLLLTELGVGYRLREGD